ncbi:MULTISPECIES: hypothetical protein [unclassified Halorubrum]|uniref:hypothetical protein n=1 Tax=unclassified Halorubrum TaxID=2642239 RepID=UPI000B991709|nr:MULTISPECIES: hypothetical protein [unclassified Halorubrum]OYR49298.1 hypothetical protein DJ75_01655 [Halorubrum sp. Eb13]OYR51906.1 hypothetical protein DJ73_11895 [Halorubrum sp. Ea1]
MEVPPNIDDARMVSFVTRFAGKDAPSRVLSAGSLAMVLLSAVGSVIAYGMLAEQLRIHWTLGMGPYYGPEFASTPLILTLFPVLVAATAVLACALDALLHDTAEFGAIRPYYVVAVLGTLGVLLGSQILLVVANL